MATSFESIYKKFLGMVDDYELGLVDDKELSEILFEYLETARSLYFPQCKKDLDKVNKKSIVPLNVEGDLAIDYWEFEEDLTSQEQYILALGMKKAWLSPKINNADLMSKSIGDRDYKAVQGTTYIKELSNLDAKIKDEIREYAVEYTYKNFSLEGW